ncbi:auxin response factor [Salix suchowensis]|nr:auxin response factor [Salix suchowensis]
MVGMIDLNTTEEDETTPSCGSLSSPSSSSAASALSASGSSTSSVCLELWHACAGPLISLPKRGSVVVYFPQGHLEQFPDLPLPVYDLPPRVFCRVVDVKLHAEAASDEVYAQVSLVPESEDIEQRLRDGIFEGGGEEEDFEATVKMTTPHMFCKTLTASDTSTHGGFSVPRRAAEDCFPPLDYTQQRPSQELVAKDLHGYEWKFRHIYRGQPRRHLLTTGWSAFVNKKKLVSGDAVLFLRGEDGELRLGVRRAVQVKCGPAFPAPCNHQLNQISFGDVANAISTRNVFHIYYNPRASSSEFIVPFNKFLKSLDQSFSAGMRFKMRFETEDAAERRYTGIITGVSELDPARWPGSKWKCLLVRWDDMEANRLSRVSPWEVEPSGSGPGSFSSSSNFMAPGLKRSRSGLPSSKAEFPIPDGIGVSDFRESSRSQEVLQGQEIMNFNALYDGVDGQNQHPSETRSCFPGSRGSGIATIGMGIRDSIATSNNSYKGINFNESYRFHKVFQGQEIFSSSPYGRLANANEASENGSLVGHSDGFQRSSSRSGWSPMMQGYNAQFRPPAQVSSPSSVLMFQHASNPAPKPSSIFNFNDHGQQTATTRSWFCDPEMQGGNFKLLAESEPSRKRDGQWSNGHFGLSHEHLQRGISQPIVAQSAFRGSQDLVSCKSSCRLFGFSLTEDKCLVNKEDNMTLITSPLNHGSSFLPRAGEQLHPKPPAINNAVGSSCTEVRGLCSVRHKLFDCSFHYISS